MSPSGTSHGERRVLGKLVRRDDGTRRGVFELGDGRHVELDGTLSFESIDAPMPGEKAFVVLDEAGEPLRWEPYVGSHARRRGPNQGHHPDAAA